MAGGGVGSSRRRRKAKTKAAASNPEATNVEGFSCNLCGAEYDSSQALGLHQKIHGSRVAKDKAEVSDDVPCPGGGVGSSGRRKPKTKAAAPNAEATNLKELSCNICGRKFNSSQDLGEHQKIHKFRLAKDKAEVSDDVPNPDKAMEKLPEEISNKTDGMQSHVESLQKLPKKVSDAAENLVPKVSDDFPYSGQATIAGGGVQSSRPGEPKPKPSFFSETKSRLAKDKLNLVPEFLEINNNVPYPDKSMEKLPEEISNAADMPSHGLQNAEKENSRDRRQELAKGLLVNKYCRICREPGDHWTLHCPNQDKAKQKLPKKVSDATKKLVPEVSGDIPYSGQATIAGGGVQSNYPSKPKPKPNFSGETKSRLAMDKEKLGMEVLEISDDVPYPGSRVPQPQGTVTLRQVLEITDALEKENCRNWQILTKKQEKCSKCGLKMGKDCIHFDENGTYKLPNCIFCNTHGDHWSYDCPKYEPETFWAVCEQTGRIPWTLYKEN